MLAVLLFIYSMAERIYVKDCRGLSWGLWSHFGLGGLGGLVGLVGLGGEGGLVGSDWVWK